MTSRAGRSEVLCADISCSCRKITAPEQTAARKSTWAGKTHHVSTGRGLKLLLDHILPIKIRLDNAAVLFA